MFYSKQRNIKERSSGMKVCWHCRYRFIQYSKCSTQNREILKKGHPEWRFVDTVDTGSSGIEDFLLKPQTPVSTVSTNIAFNALYALIFVSTVSTNKLPSCIQNVLLKTERNIKERSSGMKVCIDSVDKQDTIQYSKCSTQNREKY